MILNGFAKCCKICDIFVIHVAVEMLSVVLIAANPECMLMEANRGI